MVIFVATKVYVDGFDYSYLLVYSQPLDCDQDQDTASMYVPEFHCNHGKNILLSNSNQTIERVASYNQAIAVTNKPLARNKVFMVSVMYGMVEK